MATARLGTICSIAMVGTCSDSFLAHVMDLVKALDDT